MFVILNRISQLSAKAGFFFHRSEARAENRASRICQRQRRTSLLFFRYCAQSAQLRKSSAAPVRIPENSFFFKLKNQCHCEETQSTTKLAVVVALTWQSRLIMCRAKHDYSIIYLDPHASLRMTKTLLHFCKKTPVFTPVFRRIRRRTLLCHPEQRATEGGTEPDAVATVVRAVGRTVSGIADRVVEHPRRGRDI